jgi:prepilin-type N-terminal cleavage/methylation domain-containing protein
MKKLHDYFCSGYTLIELLIAVSLSLLLLLGVTEMFRHVGSTMSDTQKSLNMSANLNGVAMTLRSDLEKIDPRLAHQPYNMTQPSYAGDAPGYLEITEGMNAPYSATVSSGLHFSIEQVALSPDASDGIDRTVGDVDDILAFTAQANEADYPFRGLINDTMPQVLPSCAEIIWFVRGTTLYRRVLLYDEYNTSADRSTIDQVQQSFYARNDLSVHLDVTTIKANTMQELSRRERRFAHTITTFPYPLYDSTNEAWYYLRMPTLEEMSHSSWSLTNPLPTFSGTIKGNPPSSTAAYWDFWETPNIWDGLNSESGSLSSTVTTPRHPRAGEDIVLKNVISFDVKVWNPYWVPCYDIYASETSGTNVSSVSWKWAPPQYVDLGQDRFYLQNPTTQEWNWYPVNYSQDLTQTVNSTTLPNGTIIPSPPPATTNSGRGYGFVLKGRYNTSTANRRLATADATSTKKWYEDEQIEVTPTGGGSPTYRTWNQFSASALPMPCVFDSWTTQYTPLADAAGDIWAVPPPYTDDLHSIQITIRCFEPQSGHIKQVRVVQNF